MTTIKRGFGATIIGGLTTTLLLTAATPLLAEPARLRLSVLPASVDVGASAGVTVAFLDRDFRQVTNDRDRIIRLSIRPAGGRVDAAGEIQPTVRVAAGSSVAPGIRFTATRAGMLRVWAESDGLAPADALVRVGAGSTLLQRLLEPVVHAQAAGGFDILGEKKISFSALPSGRLYIVLDEPVTRKVSWQITTNPSARMRYRDRTSDGSSIVDIQTGAQSDPIILEPPALGAIAVVAKRLPNGPTVRTDVQVIPEVASRVSLAPSRARLASDIALLPLAIRLVGEDGAPLRALAGAHHIDLKSRTKNWQFDKRIILSPENPIANQVLEIPRFRLGATLNLLASDSTGSLTGDTMDLQVVAARSAVLLLAMFAGMLGSLTRFFYRDRNLHMYPRVVHGRMEHGLLVNGAFGALFGVVLLQAGDVGLLHMVVRNADHEELRIAFLLGVAGGFAGVRVFDRLSKLGLQLVPRRRVPSPSN